MTLQHSYRSARLEWPPFMNTGLNEPALWRYPNCRHTGIINESIALPDSTGQACYGPRLRGDPSWRTPQVAVFLRVALLVSSHRKSGDLWERRPV